MFKEGDKVIHKESGKIGIVKDDYKTDDAWCIRVEWHSSCEFHDKISYYTKTGRVWAEDSEPTIQLATSLHEFLAGVPHEEDT